MLLDSHKDKSAVIQRFIEEAQIGGQLQHPGIAPVYELGQFADKRPFFSMKPVKGQTLSKLMKDRTVNGTFASISPVGTSRTVGFGSLLRASHGLTQRSPTA